MDSGAGPGGVAAIRVPYRHIRDAEMELVSLNGTPRAGANGEGQPKDPDRNAHEGTSRTKLVLACMVAAGVQFGWALQLSLLTPYIQNASKRKRKQQDKDGKSKKKEFKF